MKILLTILALLYAATGIISTVGYLPTIKDLTKKIASANIHSYLVWTFTTCIAFLYALFIISDTLLEIVTGLSFVCCTTILFLAIRVKNSKK